MAQTLTARTIETIKPGRDRKEIADRHMPGLYLVLQPSGAKSWAVRYRSAGRPRKHTIGSYPAIDLKAARLLASKSLRAAAEGRDPGLEKKQERALGLDTIDALAAQFIERHCKKSNRASTAAGTERLLKQYLLPRWGGRLARDITRRDVLELLDRVVDAGKRTTANRLLAAIRKMFNWCVARDILQASPCVGVVPPSPEAPRDRVLSDAELRSVWLAADKAAGSYGALLKLLILTGQRRGEVAKMQWSEIDTKAGLWKLPAERVKNNRPHEIPLNEPALAILTALPRIGDKFVLTTGGLAPSSNYAKNQHRIKALLPADMPDWRLHDIRRTVASGMARLSIALPVIEKVLNHASGSFAGIVGVYQRHSFAEEKRRALEVWGNYVTALVSDRARKNVVNVVALRKGRGHA